MKEILDLDFLLPDQLAASQKFLSSLPRAL
jgi:hypothetical protein